MRIVGESLDQNRFTLVETFPDGSVISRLANAARLRPFTLRFPTDSAEFAASLSKDDFAAEIKSWETARIHQRAPKYRFALGTNKELLRKFEAELADDSDPTHESRVDRLMSFSYCPLTQTYEYEVKWLGFTNVFNLWLTADDIPPHFIKRFWQELEATHPDTVMAHKDRIDVSLKKRRRIPKKPLSVITAGDNPPVSDGNNTNGSSSTGFDILL
jgi:hypothetical protein